MNIFSARLRPVFVSVFLIVSMVVTTITFLLPETYASTAQLKFRSSWHVSPDDFSKVLNSDAFLGSVVDQLDLTNIWGKKYDAVPMPEADAVKILRSRLKTSVVSDSGIISVTAFSDDSHEAAQIANGVAKAVQDYLAVNKVTGGEDSHPVLTKDMVEIGEVAVPGTTPAQPNKPLNIGVGLVLGILIGAAVAALVGLVNRKTGLRYESSGKKG